MCPCMASLVIVNILKYHKCHAYLAILKDFSVILYVVSVGSDVRTFKTSGQQKKLKTIPSSKNSILSTANEGA